MKAAPRPSGLRRRRALFGPLAAAFALLALAGCGDSGLWARWRAERAFWHAQREVERILVRPQVARPADYARAEAGVRAIVDAFPASRWARPGARGTAAEVAAIAGRSQIALAKLAEVQARVPEALAGYARAESTWSGFPDLALEAATHRATLLASRNDPGAPAAWEHVARAFAAADPASGAPRPEHLQAVRVLAREFVARGRSAEIDSMFRAEEATATAWLSGHPHGANGPAWIDVLADARSRRGDVDGALAAAREVLTGAFPLDEAGRERRVLDLGERSLAAGRGDSALAYARWADRDFAGPARLQGLDLEARAFRAVGARDSALDAYERLLGDFPRQQSEAAEARFQRAVLLEEMGRWELARAEYSALCAAAPTHPRSLESWQRVIRHHLQAHEDDLARIETEHALATIDQLIGMQHDEAERTRVSEARVGVLLAAGRTREAVHDLQDLWASSGVTAAGAALGETAALEAQSRLHDAALARSLWQILARSSPDRELQKRATAALAQLPD